MPKHDLLVKMETAQAEREAAMKRAAAAKEAALADLAVWIEKYGPEYGRDFGALPPTTAVYKALEASCEFHAASGAYARASEELARALDAATSRVGVDRVRVEEAQRILDESQGRLNLFYKAN